MPTCWGHGFAANCSLRRLHPLSCWCCRLLECSGATRQKAHEIIFLAACPCQGRLPASGIHSQRNCVFDGTYTHTHKHKKTNKKPITLPSPRDRRRLIKSSSLKCLPENPKGQTPHRREPVSAAPTSGPTTCACRCDHGSLFTSGICVSGLKESNNYFYFDLFPRSLSTYWGLPTCYELCTLQRKCDGVSFYRRRWGQRAELRV